MNPAIGGEVSRLLFHSVVWGTVGKVAFDQWRATHSARQTTALARREATRRSCHSYQQLHLSMLRTQQAQLEQDRQWQRQLPEQMAGPPRPDRGRRPCQR